ncbi:ABC transporter ATP-binding protein [Rhizobium sp. KVB221]|uniref:ABC transporter ATP-binding protein n=1 Tax=Rhizobium setariae TaxID=2801340 RepID=A0A936YWU1_9HYPH|nr:ABC transporter ATP-binding protein [Rhizobium setariae]MBL0375045.1 ABC transporter ATP-binding protein [Rhizobium setariae]
MSCTTTGIGIDARGIGWAAKGNRWLIEDISFSLRPGERLAIVGPNGAGKTTLLRCLYRGLKPRLGTVALDGADIWQMSATEVARCVAVVLQESPAAFPFSVRDIVFMGRIPWRRGKAHWSQIDREQTEHALEHLGLTSLAQRRFATLSGGEQQRVLVARALAQEPRLLILDEPSNHLDIRHQLEILDLLKGLGITIITTLHDLNLAADFATSVLIMHDGRMLASGRPEAVLTSEMVSNAFGVTAQLSQPGSEAASRFTFSLNSHSGD